MRKLKKIIISFIVGILLLSPLVFFQVKYGLLEFKSIFFLRQPLWYSVSLGLLLVLMDLVFPPLEKFLTATFSFKYRWVFLEILPLILAYGGSLSTLIYPHLLFFILSIYVVVRLAFFHAKWDWLFFLLGALFFPTLEIMGSSFHLLQYSDADFLGIPYWLPLQWGVLALSARRFIDVIEARVQ
ncbi:MAG: hypothetical protein HQM15_01005 [Deltaproteobacteria bacterium]|nr:hypothetical protein [Deltaproteobacteria bacterium]